MYHFKILCSNLQTRHGNVLCLEGEKGQGLIPRYHLKQFLNKIAAFIKDKNEIHFKSKTKHKNTYKFSHLPSTSCFNQT